MTGHDTPRPQRQDRDVELSTRERLRRGLLRRGLINSSKTICMAGFPGLCGSGAARSASGRATVSLDPVSGDNAA